MDVAVSVSLLKDQLGSVIEHAVRAAVEMVLTEMATLMGSKFEDIRKEMKAKEKENESMKQMLEISRCQMKTLRKYMSAVGAKDERHAATPRKSWKEPEPHRHYCPDVAAPLALKRTRKEPGTAAFSKTMKDLLESNACVSPIALQTQRCGGALPDVSSRTVPGRCSGAPASSPAQIDPHQPCRTGDTTDGTRVKEESRDVADAEGAAQRNTAEHQEPLSEKDRGAGGKGATEGTPSEVKGQESPKHYSPVVDPELGSVRIKEEVAEIETVCIKEEPDEAGHTSQGQCADACALDSLGFIKDECHVPQSRLEEGSTASVRFTNCNLPPGL
ncbi:uncharacterized protein LOC136711490 [Amia ocellicauda]|uniref:uncharacterized protein LOC136711490 n=1 Tax=Amia ocellicauda TaxID=2972642 RepID=UPI0034640AB9